MSRKRSKTKGRVTGLVVVAGGSGQRFGAPKQFAPLGGWPLLAWCLFAFEQLPAISHRVVVLPRGAEADEAWRRIVPVLSQLVLTVPGGTTRAESVRAGTEALPEECEFVAVHDGARPFPPLRATAEAIERLAASSELDAVLVARRATETVKQLEREDQIKATLDRGKLALAETPQVCRREALLRALFLPGGAKTTDEAHAIERAGGKTALVFHHGWNPKVTLPQDLALASAWLATGEAISFHVPSPHGASNT